MVDAIEPEMQCGWFWPYCRLLNQPCDWTNMYWKCFNCWKFHNGWGVNLDYNVWVVHVKVPLDFPTKNDEISLEKMFGGRGIWWMKYWVVLDEWKNVPSVSHDPSAKLLLSILSGNCSVTAGASFCDCIQDTTFLSRGLKTPKCSTHKGKSRLLEWPDTKRKFQGQDKTAYMLGTWWIWIGHTPLQFWYTQVQFYDGSFSYFWSVLDFYVQNYLYVWRAFFTIMYN